MFGTLYFSSEVVLENGCDEELEIRGCSIEAVERINNRVLQLLKKNNSVIICNSILIDNFLWEYRRNHLNEFDIEPFHRVVSVYY